MKTNSIKAKDTEILVSGKGKTLDRILNNSNNDSSSKPFIIVQKEESTAIEDANLCNYLLNNSKDIPIVELLNIYVYKNNDYPNQGVIPIADTGYNIFKYDALGWNIENSNGDMYRIVPNIVNNTVYVSWTVD